MPTGLRHKQNNTPGWALDRWRMQDQVKLVCETRCKREVDIACRHARDEIWPVRLATNVQSKRAV